MNYRKYGKSEKLVSEIGFGAWQLGNEKDWDGPKYEEAINLVHTAVELGCNFFDTAPNYAEGKSEMILGEALKDFNREKIVINTKVGHVPGLENGFDPYVIQKTIENSLKKLKTDYLDSVILHNPPLELLDQKSEQFKVLEKMKSEGLIKAYGASLDFSKEVDRLIERTYSEVVEILFNIFFQDVRKSFNKLKEKEYAVIVKVPLDSGWLTGKHNKNSRFTGIRSRWSVNDIERRAMLVEKVRKIKGENVSMVHEALSFILSYDAISTIAVGSKNIEQLKENLKASDIKMDIEKVKKYEELYDNEIAPNPLPW
ncbi:aldo/keto reductase [Thermosipho africanus Ob7]|uniref:aldo/keto reductase n=1 Tax=Thermosipho africanus TaxID=2421 RepID=UPI000E0C660E|nr:aldo/keto reductase [Thermosipho africanus]RDI90885.1 aldo/keto reductase [Thermosipho africanus Ob7]